jgi:hypothetical protein
VNYKCEMQLSDLPACTTCYLIFFERLLEKNGSGERADRESEQVGTRKAHSGAPDKISH